MLINNNDIIWILVAEGAKAYIYISYLNKQELKLLHVLENPDARLHDHELDSGNFKPHGVSGKNKPESKVDLHHKEEERFAHKIADIINDGAEKHEYQKLMLICPPKFLGMLRPLIKKQAHALIVKEINKDLIHLPKEELKHHIWD